MTRGTPLARANASALLAPSALPEPTTQAWACPSPTTSGCWRLTHSEAVPT